MPFLFGPGKVHIGESVFEADLSSVSEANGEGVEGEPQATLGGRSGSPRTGQWCRYCGSVANPSSDACVPCWSSSMTRVMEIGEAFDKAMVVLTKATITAATAFDPALLPPQWLDPATP